MVESRWGDHDVAVAGGRLTACITALGAPAYHRAAAACVRSVLWRTDWEVVLVADGPVAPDLFTSPRVVVHQLDPATRYDRAERFLAKIDGLAVALEASDAELFCLLDADTRVVGDVTAADASRALGPHALGMVEQTGIRGSDMDRARFREHYRDVSLRVIDPEGEPPPLEIFRYHNSGVVLGRRDELAAFCRWARARRAEVGSHAVGDHIVGDQDYLQHWACGRRPGVCVDLDWSWNHCAWWDDPFPRDGARIVHFSNFTQGPTAESLAEMDAIEAGYRGEAPVGVTGVVVTHRSARTLPACLRAQRLAGIGETVVVDNLSDDDSVDVAERHGARVLRLAANHGFAAAANAGLRVARGAVVAFVNPDCVVDAATVDAAVALCRTDDAVLACPDLIEGDGGQVPGVRAGYTRRRLAADLAGPRLAGPLARTPRYDDPTWGWAHGACLFADRRRLLAVGGFDEAYPLYMEDVELGRRWCSGGGRVAATGTSVRHIGAAGSAIDPVERARRLREARLLYARRVYGPVTAWALARFAEGVA